MRRFSRVLAGAIGVVGLAAGGLAAITGTAAAAPQTLTATADGFVSEGSSGTVYSTYQDSRVAGNGTTEVKISYFVFDVPAGVTSAKLKFTVTGVAQPTRTVNLHKATSNYTNTTTWNNRPAIGAPVGTLALAPNAKPEADVLPQLPSGGGTVTFAVATKAGGADNFIATRENATVTSRPVLVVDTAPAGDTQAPTVPTGVTATASSSTAATVSWTASTDNVGVTGYEVSRGATVVAPNVTGTTFNDTGLTPSTAYSYTVKAKDAAGNISAASAVANVTTPAAPDTQAPSVPANLKATVTAAPAVDLTWDAATDNTAVTGYKVLRDGAALGDVTATNYTDSTVEAGRTYSYAVKAFDAAGNVSAASAPAQAVIPAPPPPPPAGAPLMVVTQAQLDALPTTGTAWTNLLNIANGTSFPVNIDDQDNITSGKLVAVGLVYAKTQNPAYKTKVVTALDQLKTAQPTSSSRVLSWGRQIAGYAIAASLVGYNDPALKTWMSNARTVTLPGHAPLPTMEFAASHDAGNWGAWNMASYTASSIYVGDTAAVNNAYTWFKGMMGDTAAWAQFQNISEYDPTWVCGQPAKDDWHGPAINPACDSQRDGAAVLDIARSATSFPTPDDRGRMYSWESLSGWTLAARVFDYNGKTDVYGLSNSALKRAAGFLQRNGGWPAQFSASYCAAVALEKVYATDFGALPPYGPARSFAGTDWLPATSSS